MNVCVIERVQNPRLEVGGPTVHWLGPEMLVELTMEGRNFDALADSGRQVNTITPTLVQQYGFPVLPLEDLVDYPLNLMGLGGKCTSPLGFVILHIQVQGIAGYDEDTVFLVVPDESDFRRRVPLVVGTCTIGRMINVIQESEIDSLTTLWSTTRVARLLSCQLGMTVPASEGAETPVEGARQAGYGVGEHLPWAIPDRDHRGTGEAPPRIYLICDDHSVKSGRPTSGNQTTSPGTPCPSCPHPPQKRQWKGVFGGQKCV